MFTLGVYFARLLVLNYELGLIVFLFDLDIEVLMKLRLIFNFCCMFVITWWFRGLCR